MIDYSQNGEQTIILDFFRRRQPGVFLDIGANDGATLSNSRALALIGWHGVCVEPAPTPFAKLSELYKDSSVKCINAAITTADGPIDFWDCGVHLHKGDTSLLSTTKEDELARWKRSGEQFTKTTVRGITFATLLNECGREKFDFITIDAEGADFDILQQIDLRAVGCQLLCVETNHKEDFKFVNYAAKSGLRLMFKNAENLIFG